MTNSSDFIEINASLIHFINESIWDSNSNNKGIIVLNASFLLPFNESDWVLYF